MALELVKIRSCSITGLPVEANGPSNQRLGSSIFRILEGNVLCSISTVTPENGAHINTAYFSYSNELEIYFLSHPASLHCRNLSANSSVAITVFSSSQNWTEPGQGLQLFGNCTQVRGRQVTKAEVSYGKRFPAFGSWKVNLNEDDDSRDYRFYRIITARLKVHDEKTFGDGVFIFADAKRT
jgi:uncharacterized protein YhbP (UPF0306 family)